ncbi:MAG: hypothetical protein R6U68_13935 [Desulfobacteraceae bacterium]
MFIPVGLFGQAVGVASYPFMARLAGEKGYNVVRKFYAVQNTWFPALFGTVAVLSSLPLFFLRRTTRTAIFDRLKFRLVMLSIITSASLGMA